MRQITEKFNKEENTKDDLNDITIDELPYYDAIAVSQIMRKNNLAITDTAWRKINKLTYISA